MMSNRDIFGQTESDPPVLVCADLQCEYLAEGRKHLIADGELVMSRCRQLLALWRGNLWPIIHLKRIAQAAWFNPASNLTNWLPEFRPTPGELSFEHPLPSAYSSARFAEYMSNMRRIRCVLLGFSLDETILSTVVDGFHRSHRYQVIEDAVACRQACAGDAATYRLVVTGVIGNFAGVLDSADLSKACGRLVV
ncbi:isochorismatase family protein [Bradyrhizobium sp. HKCCYLS20291]|uniref:isochorismatase family protein n=1 Tax=Bradyrhizobium sp. HKCCYLS20291 TaxID=3420766 RepID=UPI003EB7788A